METPTTNTHESFKGVFHALWKNKPLFFTIVAAGAFVLYMLWKNQQVTVPPPSTTTSHGTGTMMERGYYAQGRHTPGGLAPHSPLPPVPQPVSPMPVQPSPIQPAPRTRRPPRSRPLPPQPLPQQPGGGNFVNPIGPAFQQPPPGIVYVNGLPISIPQSGTINIGPSGIPVWSGGGSASGAWQPAIP